MVKMMIEDACDGAIRSGFDRSLDRRDLKEYLSDNV
jgi:hypothetical protein